MRLVVKLTPVAFLVIPFTYFDRHLRDTEAGRLWVRHTHEARHLAETAYRQAGCDPDPIRLARTLDEFADWTADNASQARRVKAMRAAMERGDLKGVSQLAEEAESEERRLLDVRQSEQDRRWAVIRAYCYGVAAVAFVLIVASEVLDFFLRRMGVGQRDRRFRDREDDLLRREGLVRDQEQFHVDLINGFNDLRRENSIYQSREERDRSHQAWMDKFQGLADSLPGGADDAGPGR